MELNNSPAGTAALGKQIRPRDIPALTGLRIVGAGWVVLYHFQPNLYEAWPKLEVLKPILSQGNFGVPLFFILSGFIIWHNYAGVSLLKLRTLATFMFRRIARLWPVNVLTQALAIPLIWWAVEVKHMWGAPIPDWYSIGGWLQAAFMIQELGHPDQIYPWNQPSWSLSGEMAAYIIFPLIFVIMGILKARFWGRQRWVWFVIAIVSLFLAQTSLPPGLPYYWLVYLLIVFASGVMIYLAGEPPQALFYPVAVLQVVAPVALIVVCYMNRTELISVVLLLWVYSLRLDSGPIAWLFSLRGAQVAGLSSYSVYMTHWVIFGYGSLLLYYVPWIKETSMKLYIVAMLLVVALASWLLWKYFENPSRRAMNRKFDEILAPRRREKFTVSVQS